MLDDALALSLPAPDNLKAFVPDSPHSLAMLQDASFSEPEKPANLIRISGKEMPFVEEMVGGKSVHDVVTDINSTIDASIDEGVSNLFLLRDSSTPEDRVPKPDPSRYIVLQRDREGEREGEREREGNIYIYIHTHTHTYTYTHAQIHIGSGQRWTGWTWRIGGRRGRTRRL